MYFGSIRFFKHMILLALAFFALLPYAVLIFVSVSYNVIDQENRRLSEQILQAQVTRRDAPHENKAFGLEAMLPAVELLNPLKEPIGEHSPPSFSYQGLYPDLYCAPPVNQVNKEKTAYLTFDDGPTRYTDDILAVLEKHNVKATFFVVGKDTEEDRARMRRIVDAGHEIAVHSYSHVYTKIYHSADNYLDDFYRIYQLILDTTGTASTIFRFPGGSINSYNRLVYQEVIAEMTRRGFTYYDWNVSAGDAAPNVNAKQIKTNILDNFERFTCPIILMHDGYTDTLHALDDIITGIEAKGYSFEVLTDSVTPVMFSYKD